MQRSGIIEQLRVKNRGHFPKKHNIIYTHIVTVI